MKVKSDKLAKRMQDMTERNFEFKTWAVAIRGGLQLRPTSKYFIHLPDPDWDDYPHSPLYAVMAELGLCPMFVPREVLDCILLYIDNEWYNTMSVLDFAVKMLGEKYGR